MPMLAIHHVSLIVTDLDRSVDFYQRIFGLTRMDRPPFKVEGVWLACGELQLHLVVYPGGSFRTRPVDNDDSHFAFRTDDFEVMVERLRANGFSDALPPADPYHMILKRTGLAGFPQLYFCDPDRNIIEVNGAR